MGFLQHMLETNLPITETLHSSQKNFSVLTASEARFIDTKNNSLG